jgi:hypothetical protein
LTLQTGISRSIILKAQCITTFEPQEPSPLVACVYFT